MFFRNTPRGSGCTDEAVHEEPECSALSIFLVTGEDAVADFGLGVDRRLREGAVKTFPRRNCRTTGCGARLPQFRSVCWHTAEGSKSSSGWAPPETQSRCTYLPTPQLAFTKGRAGVFAPVAGSRRAALRLNLHDMPPLFAFAGA